VLTKTDKIKEKIMHQGFKSVSLIILLSFTISAGAAEKKLTLTIRGGSGFIGSGGDMKPYFDSSVARMSYVGYTGTFGYDYHGNAFDLALAADWRLARAFGLRLEIGDTVASWKDNMSVDYSWGPGTIDETSTYKLSAVPITLAAVLHKQAGKIGLQVGAGPTVYLAKFKYDSDYTYSEPHRAGKPNWIWVTKEAFDSNLKAALGGQVFASASYPVSGRFSIVLEGSYRLAPISKIKGTYKWDDTATWTGGSSSHSFPGEDYYVWFSTSVVSGQTWHYMKFWNEIPTTSDESRHFKFDLDGFYLRLGVQIRL
jgi:hypothetical protein